MAVQAPAAPRTAATTRPKREREQELLVWPDLVFVEFISAVVFLLTFLVLSTVLDAPLLDRANLNVTPNPSKAPWYFMNLQELLLHMHPATAGVVTPTVALLLLAALPYVDRSNDGQGQWFGTPNAVKITLFAFAFSAVVIPALLLYDQGRHVNVTENVAHNFDEDWEWPVYLDAFRNVRAIQTTWQWSVPVPESTQLGGGEHDGELNWPEDFAHVPMPFNGTSGPEWMRWDDPQWMPGWMQAMYWYDLNLNFPAFLVEQMIPVAVMVGLPIIMLIMMRLFGWLYSPRDIAIALFTGFIVTYFALTIVGAGFRGSGQDLVLPWDVPNLE
jgi:hypothetical protein